MNELIPSETIPTNNEKGFPFFIAIPVLLVLIAFVLWYGGREVSNDQYNYILQIAKQCQRDTCDTISDAISDGAITIEESLPIVVFQSHDVATSTDNPKSALIELVKTDNRFRDRG